MFNDRLVSDIKDAAKRWSEENPGLHPTSSDYGKVMQDAADAIESLVSVRWKKVNGRFKPRPKNFLYAYKKGWIYPVVAYMNTDGKFISMEYGEIQPEWWASITYPSVPKEEVD